MDDVVARYLDACCSVARDSEREYILGWACSALSDLLRLGVGMSRLRVLRDYPGTTLRMRNIGINLLTCEHDALVRLHDVFFFAFALLREGGE